MQEMQEMWIWSLGLVDPLEKEMVIHSSILARKISGTEELADYSPWGHKKLGTTESMQNSQVQILGGRKFSIHLSKCHRAWSLDLMIRVCLILKGTVKLSSEVSALFLHSTRKYERSYCSSSLSASGGFSVLNSGHFSKCVELSHYFENFQFHNDVWYRASFHMLTFHLCIFFGKMSAKVFGPFIIALFSFCWALRVLCVSRISIFIRCFVWKYFLPDWLVFFYALDLSFTEQKFLILMKFCLPFLSWTVPLVLGLKCLCHTQDHLGFLPCSLLGVLYFTFRSVIRLS